MPRVINRIERISDDFDRLDKLAQVDIVAELFTRLDKGQADHAQMLMNFWAKKQDRNGTPRKHTCPKCDGAGCAECGQSGRGPAPEGVSL